MTMKGYLKSLGAVSLVGLLMFLSGADVFAQGAPAVDITPIVDFSGVFDGLMDQLTGPVAVGIGISLSLFIVFVVVRVIKRSARA